MTAAICDLTELVEILLNRIGENRLLVAIAGPPGVGKSTFSEKLRDALNKRNEGLCEVLAMDGYHYDDIYLKQKGWHERKGAPHTFDVGGLKSMLIRLRENAEEKIAIPIFDRELEIARAGASEISSEVNIVLVEGNYLLLDQSPWHQLARYFDCTIMLSAPYEKIIERLNNRWVSFNYSPKQLEEKMASNDLPNVDFVLNNSKNPDFLVSTDN